MQSKNNSWKTEDLRKEAKKNFLKIQHEKRKQFTLLRKNLRNHILCELAAIKRIQQGPGIKLKSKFKGSYKVTKIKLTETYDVEKIELTEKPMNATTCSKNMKP